MGYHVTVLEIIFEFERDDKCKPNVHGLTVQLLVQSLDLPRLLDQADGFAVDVRVGLIGAVEGDACKQAREPPSWPECRYTW